MHLILLNFQILGVWNLLFVFLVLSHETTENFLNVANSWMKGAPVFALMFCTACSILLYFLLRLSAFFCRKNFKKLWIKNKFFRNFWVSKLPRRDCSPRSQSPGCFPVLLLCWFFFKRVLILPDLIFLLQVFFNAENVFLSGVYLVLKLLDTRFTSVFFWSVIFYFCITVMYFSSSLFSCLSFSYYNVKVCCNCSSRFLRKRISFFKRKRICYREWNWCFSRSLL